MQLHPEQRGWLDEYLDAFLPLMGDKRTAATFRGTVQGIIGSESLICTRIAAFSPVLATSSNNGEQRVRRMANGQTTKRSDLTAQDLVERLQARGAEQLREQDEVWAIIDPSELRKPHARQMPELMQVRRLSGEGTVPGYRTLNVLGVGRGGRRGILYHRLFSSQEDDFLSESTEIRNALLSVGRSLGEHAGRVTYIVDTQFDDEAVWGAIWEQRNHLVCRIKHRERLVERCVERTDEAQAEQVCQRVSVEEASSRGTELARVRTEMLVRKPGQRYTKRQPVTAVVSACPIRVTYQVEVRTRKDGECRVKPAWVVIVRLQNVDSKPWVLLTDWPVEDEQSALRVFRMYRERWAVEDCFKFTKQMLGWEDVQLMDLEGIRTLVALGWVAAGFLYELGVTLEWPEIRLLARLGGWTQRKDRPPGKTILTRGLQRVLDRMAMDAILRDEVARHGHLPPRIAALLGVASQDLR